MEKCNSVLIREPEMYFGKWRSEIEGFSELHLELGCGKGRFTIETAKMMPDVLIVAIERVPNAMVIAMERAINEKITNVRFVDGDAENLADIFDKDEAGRIYINFCDPWPAKRHAKRRLTSKLFLEKYKNILGSGGEIHFKTDNSGLFEYSLEQFAENGFELSEVTRNLHEHGVTGNMTDYELKFFEQGIAIKRCVARVK